MAVIGNFARTAWRALTLARNNPPNDLGIHSPYYSPSVAAYYSTPKDHVVAKLYNKIATDVSNATFRHIRVNEDNNYVENYSSSLSERMALMANVDQTWARFVQDVVWQMMANGAAAIVATDTSEDPRYTESYSVDSLRVGSVVQWYPRHVKVDLYDDREGDHKEIILPKEVVAIASNPLYAVINAPNSDLQRLLEKLRILDAIDQQSGSGKLNLIFQLPYTINNQMRAKRSKVRQKEVEDQLANSKYGIAFSERGEGIVQINRPLTNNLMDQVTWLTDQVYSSLGISQEVFTGKATEEQMGLYYTTTVNPILDEIATVMTATFLSKTARTQGQRIRWFRDPFELVPMSRVGDLAQALTSAEIMTSNEVRPHIGLPLSTDPTADKLVNANINQTSGARPSVAVPAPEGSQNDSSEEA